MLDILLTVIFGMIDIFVCCNLFKNFFDAKIRNRPKIFFLCGIFIAIIIINKLILKSFHKEEIWMYYERTWITIILGMGFCFLSFRGKILEMILMFTIFYICEVISESIIMVILLIMRLDYKHMTINQEIIECTVQKIITFIFAKIIEKNFKLRRRKIEGKLFMSLIMLPLITISISIYLYRMKVSSPQDEFFVAISIPLLISCNFLVFAVIEKVSRLQYEHYELDILKNKADMEKKYYDHLDEIEQHQVAIRHDIKHYISVMKVMLEENKTEEMKKLVHSFEDEMTRITPEKYTNNRIVNVVLSDKRETAKKNGINLDFNIEPNTDISYISDLDSISLFSNLIDNAIRAESESESGAKIIELKFFETEGNFNVLNIRNHFSRIEKKDGAFVTTKTEEGIHGIGLKNIQKIVSKYNGIFSTEIHEENGTRIFEVSICLPKSLQIS